MSEAVVSTQAGRVGMYGKPIEYWPVGAQVQTGYGALTQETFLGFANILLYITNRTVHYIWHVTEPAQDNDCQLSEHCLITYDAVCTTASKLCQQLQHLICVV